MNFSDVYPQLAYCIQELSELLEEEKLQGVPMLVFASKQDLALAETPAEVRTVNCIVLGWLLCIQECSNCVTGWRSDFGSSPLADCQGAEASLHQGQEMADPAMLWQNW